jgi:hypothetical protein
VVFQSFHCGGYLCSFKLIGVRLFGKNKNLGQSVPENKEKALFLLLATFALTSCRKRSEKIPFRNQPRIGQNKHYQFSPQFEIPQISGNFKTRTQPSHFNTYKK